MIAQRIGIIKLKFLTLAIAVLATLAVSACSSSSDDSVAGVDDQFPSAGIDSGPESLIVTGYDDTNPDATSPWLVNLNMFRLNSRLSTTGDLDVDLVRYEDDFPVSRHVEFYTVNLDTCEFFDPDAISTDPDNGNNDSPPPTISGGIAVVINTPSGPWFTLNQTVEDGEPIYSANNELPGELLPTGTTLSIPGDEFPTVAAHPLFEPVAPDRLLPDETEPVTADSAFTWIPAEGKSYIDIDLLAYDAEDNFVDFVVDCDVRDDGEFKMPDEVINFVSTTPYNLKARYTRQYNRIDFVNDIVIRQKISIAE